MCGIAGFSSEREADIDGVLRAMGEALRHRGPDDSGVWFNENGTLGLAHTRLSVIDLSDAARQPMMYGDGSYIIVFNGEIYNYKELREVLAARGYVFRSSGDTEVIVASYQEWGVECVKRLQGMFAFAIYDRKSDSVIMARDRAGEKPIYYAHTGSEFVFGSELKALLKCPTVRARLSLRAMNFFLAYGYVPGSMCILDCVRKLPAGHILVYERERSRVRIEAYWTVPNLRIERAEDPELLMDELEELLASSVQRQMVADVPLAVLLSGGVDSSVIAALAARVARRPIRTFTVSFPGHAGIDEAAHARIVADYLGTIHTVLRAEVPPPDLLLRLARQYDEPLGDSSMIPTYLVSCLVKQHATVAMGGDGGDELFGGYLHYAWLLRQARMRRWLPVRVRNIVGRVAGRMLPLGTRARNALLAMRGEIKAAYSYVHQYFDFASRFTILPRLNDLAEGEWLEPEGYKGSLIRDGLGTVHNGSLVDFLTYLPDDVLMKVDRASMLASLEVRAPFLDHRIVEFAFERVPDALKAGRRGRKILLRMLARRLLPPTLNLDRKQGFAAPVAEWFRGHWGAWIKDVLLSPGCCFAQEPVRRLIDNQERGLVNMHRIFALTMFELWRREYRIQL